MHNTYGKCSLNCTLKREIPNYSTVAMLKVILRIISCVRDREEKIPLKTVYCAPDVCSFSNSLIAELHAPGHAPTKPHR